MSDIFNINDLGAALRKERKARGLTQSALAKIAGISRQTVISVEKGDDSSVMVLLKICRAMGLRIRMLTADHDYTQLGALLDEE